MHRLSLAARLLLLLAVSASSLTAAQQQPFHLPPPPTSTVADDIVFTAASPDAVDFTGQRVVRLTTATARQHHALLDHANHLGLDVWAAQLGGACSSSRAAEAYGCIDLRLASSYDAPIGAAAAAPPPRDWLAELLAPLHPKPHVATMIEDLQQLVAAQRSEARIEAAGGKHAWHRDYHTLEEIEDHMLALQHAYPRHAQVVQIGTTHEGRPIRALKLSSDLPTSPGDDPQEPEEPKQPEEPDEPGHESRADAMAGQKLGIVIAGGQHAREWVSTSSALYFAEDLLATAYGPMRASPNTTTEVSGSKRRKGRKGRKGGKVWSKKEARAVLSVFSISVVGVANPDGYAYSWSKNRMWRKNRQPNRFPSGLFCKGVDVNRNFDYAFQAGGNPCSEMYAGSEAFSSAEALALARYIQDEVNNVVGFFDLHSYGQLMMYPFSYDCTAQVADEEDLLEASLGAIKALKGVHGRVFTAGKVCQVYAQAGGNAVDWSYAKTTGSTGQHKEKVKWSFSIELRDGGTYGFLLPKTQIIPAAQEAQAAIAYLLNFIQSKSH